MADRTRRAEGRTRHHITAPGKPHPLDGLGARVKVMGDCWVVDGDVDKYPSVTDLNHTERANRYIWRQTHRIGRLPSAVHIHHTCEVKGCINPNPLVALTASDHRRVHSGSASLDDVVMTADDLIAEHGAVRLID